MKSWKVLPCILWNRRFPRLTFSSPHIQKHKMYHKGCLCSPFFCRHPAMQIQCSGSLKSTKAWILQSVATEWIFQLCYYRMKNLDVSLFFLLLACNQSLPMRSSVFGQSSPRLQSRKAPNLVTHRAFEGKGCHVLLDALNLAPVWNLSSCRSYKCGQEKG